VQIGTKRGNYAISAISAASKTHLRSVKGDGLLERGWFDMFVQNTALIVLDVQESFRHRPFFRDDDLPTFIERLQTLIDGAKSAGIPVVQIFHVAETGPFAETSGFVTTLAPLRPC
jgi:hypothetical protein